MPSGTSRTRSEALALEWTRAEKVVGAAVVAAYLVAFVVVPMPSLAGAFRGETPSRLLAGLFLVMNVPGFVESWFGTPPEFTWLDRLPLLLVAIMILATALSMGRLLLRTIGWRAETPLETGVYALAVGVGALSLYTLLVGLAGGLRLAVVWWLPGTLCLVLEGGLTWRQTRMARRARSLDQDSIEPSATRRDRHWGWWGVPCAVAIVWGGMLPPVEYDVREYHLQVPKEFFQSGRIGFLPHNVYGNMTIGLELLSLPAMALFQDWWLGALTGKTITALLTLVTAAAVFAIGRRRFSPAAGGVGAVCYLTIPWIVQNANLGLVDAAVGLFLVLALEATCRWSSGELPPGVAPASQAAVAGWLAGVAVACKYPAALFVLLPLAVWVISGGRRNGWMSVATFLLAAMAACGPWFAKNVYFTGNPTYPLLYELFDGATRTPEKNAQFLRAHRPHDFHLSALPGDAWRWLGGSEWASPALAPLAAVGLWEHWRRRRTSQDRGSRRSTGPLAAWAGFCALGFAAWWLATHRIDRFYLPFFPVVALVAAAGADALFRRQARRVVLVLIGLTASYATLLAGSLLVPDPRFFVALQTLRNDPERVDPWHLELNRRCGDDAILLVGEAQAFDLAMPVFYNTVFDDDLLQTWSEGRSSAEFHQELSQRDIRYVLVHWGELARYRKQGNYGYSDYVQPELFERWVNDGVLAPPLAPLPGRQREVYPVLPWSSAAGASP